MNTEACRYNTGTTRLLSPCIVLFFVASWQHEHRGMPVQLWHPPSCCLYYVNIVLLFVTRRQHEHWGVPVQPWHPPACCLHHWLRQPAGQQPGGSHGASRHGEFLYQTKQFHYTNQIFLSYSTKFSSYLNLFFNQISSSFIFTRIKFLFSNQTFQHKI